MKEKAQTIKLQQAVADFYESFGPAFSQSRSKGWGIMNMIAGYIHPHDVVIDVGAGNARLADDLPQDIRYVAIEPSSTLRADAERRLASHADAEVRAGGFPDLPSSDAEANVTVSLAVIHHIPTRMAQRAAIAELARITKPDGIAIVTAWNLRGRRMKSWTTWLAAWLRVPMVWGGECGDVWIPWKAGGAHALRFVHAFTIGELQRLFDPVQWEVLRAEAWGDDAPAQTLDARNVVIVARRK